MYRLVDKRHGIHATDANGEDWNLLEEDEPYEEPWTVRWGNAFDHTDLHDNHPTYHRILFPGDRPTPENPFSKIFYEKMDRHRAKAVEYYQQLMMDAAKRGETSYRITQRDFDNAPKLGDGLGFRV